MQKPDQQYWRNKVRQLKRVRSANKNLSHEAGRCSKQKPYGSERLVPFQQMFQVSRYGPCVEGPSQCRYTLMRRSMHECDKQADNWSPLRIIPLMFIYWLSQEAYMDHLGSSSSAGYYVVAITSPWMARFSRFSFRSIGHFTMKMDIKKDATRLWYHLWIPIQISITAPNHTRPLSNMLSQLIQPRRSALTIFLDKRHELA